MRVMSESQLPTPGAPMIRFPLMHGVNPLHLHHYYQGNPTGTLAHF